MRSLQTNSTHFTQQESLLLLNCWVPISQLLFDGFPTIALCAVCAGEGRFCSSLGTPVLGWRAKTYPLVYGSFVPDAGERQKLCAKLQAGPCLRAGCPSRTAVLSEAAIGTVLRRVSSLSNYLYIGKAVWSWEINKHSLVG